MNTAHTIDTAGRFSFPSSLLETAGRHGISVESAGGGQYRLNAQNGSSAALLPGFAQNPEGTLPRQTVRRVLEFLHQPLRVSAESQDASKKDNHLRRVELHRVLRFAVKGSVEIPADSFEGLDKETAECHAKTEQAMRDADGWLGHLEIGNPETSQSALPRTEIDPARGFVFHLDRRTLGLDAYPGKAQNTLNARFWNAVNEATGNRYAVKTPTVVMSAQELETFCAAVLREPPGPLLECVEFEEAVQQKLESITQRSRSLEHSFVFRRLTKDQPKDRAQQLQEMMRCTSALAPVMDSQSMHKLWARYNFMERHESPLAGLSKEYGVFLAVMDNLASRGPVTPAQLEALSYEFLPLIAFSEQFVQKMEKASMEAGDATQAATLHEARETFKGATSTGILPSARSFKDDYGQTLAVVEKSIGRSGNALSNTAQASVDTAIDFTMDVVNFIRESPRVAATFAGLATTLYVMNGGDAQSAQAATDTIMMFDGTEMPIDISTLPEEAQEVQNWHWDMGPFGLYKHYMYDNAVVGPAQSIMDGLRIGVQWGYDLAGLPVDEQAAFSQAADKVVKPMADQLFKLNLFQNFSHAAFWMYMVSKGYNHGFRGANRIFELLSPMTNLAVHGGSRLGEMLHLKKNTSLSERIAALGYGSQGETERVRYEPAAATLIPTVPASMLVLSPNLSCEGPLKRHTGGCVVVALAQAAQERVALSDVPVSEKTVQIHSRKLKQTFEINAETLPPLMRAIDGFDLAMTHAASQIGAAEPWKKAFVAERINTLRTALRRFGADGDGEALQAEISSAIEDLAGAQMVLAGDSPLYAAAAGHAPDEGERSNLLSFANAKFGRLKRDARTNELKRRLNEGQDKDGQALTLTGVTKTRSALAANHIWGAMVDSARAIKKAVKPIANKTSVIALSGLAAGAVALDMAGAGNDFTDAVSSGTGAALSASMTTLTFLVYNFWEDVLGVHVGGGAMLLAAGAAAGYLARRGIMPTSLAASDLMKKKTGFDPVSAWERLTQRMEKAADSFTSRWMRFNLKAGQSLTPGGGSGKTRLSDGDGRGSGGGNTESGDSGVPACDQCPFNAHREQAGQEPNI